jgi:predicted phage terminase large subunit-like protein
MTEQQDSLPLTSDLIFAITVSMLVSLFDSPKPTPDCHLEWWDLCCLPDQYVAIAAPRGHAKSTAVTFCYVFCMLLLGKADYIIIMSNTETQASGFLAMIARAIRELPDIEQYGLKRKLIKSNETELIGEFADGRRWCIRARGHTAQLRGLWFEGRRPNLIVADDLEDKDTIDNPEVRSKNYARFVADVVPALSDYGVLRVVGTILHEDSVLSNLLDDDDMWVTARYAAHNEDFSQILWPEKFSKEKLQRIQRSWAKKGKSDEYANEYLNQPIAKGMSFFREADLQLVEPDFYRRMNLTKYIIADLAVTEKQKNDPTAIGVFGVSSEGDIFLLDAELARMDTADSVDLIFDWERRYKPEEVIMENGVIKHAIGPFIYKHMQETNQYFALEGVTPVNSKKMRAQSIKTRMRMGKVYMNSEIECLPAWTQQLLSFPKAKHDDAVDVMAYMGLRLADMNEGKSEEEEEEEQEAQSYAEYIEFGGDDGRDADTGY